MHMMFTRSTNSFTWLSQTIDRFHTFKVELSDGGFDAFSAAFSACLYESSSHIDFTKKVKVSSAHSPTPTLTLASSLSQAHTWSI